MNTYEWSLDALYKGYDDPQFKKDLARMDHIHASLKDFCAGLPYDDEETALKDAIALLEEEYEYSYRLHLYTILRQSVDTSDRETLSYLNIVNSHISSFSVYKAKIKSFIAHIKDLDRYIEKDERLRQYTFILHEMQTKAKHALSDEAEGILSEIGRAHV